MTTTHHYMAAGSHLDLVIFLCTFNSSVEALLSFDVALSAAAYVGKAFVFFKFVYVLSICWNTRVFDIVSKDALINYGSSKIDIFAETCQRTSHLT